MKDAIFRCSTLCSESAAISKIYYVSLGFNQKIYFGGVFFTYLSFSFTIFPPFVFFSPFFSLSMSLNLVKGFGEAL